MPTTEMLYHYTTPDGLIGILKTGTLWATNAFYLNDSSELIKGVGIAKGHLHDASKASNDPLKIARIKWLLNDIRNVGTPINKKSVFVCSLTTQNDQLSQWRAYCRGGGYAIGFPLDQLRDFVQTQHCELQECVYGEAEQHTLMTSVVDSVSKSWIEGSQSPVAEDDRRFEVSGKLIWELLRTTPRIKDDSYSEECESRIISQPEFGYDAEQREFRSRKGVVVPYIKVKLSDNIDFWGRVRVMVGPTQNPIEAKEGVSDLVRRYRGHTMGIDVSPTPYREL